MRLPFFSDALGRVSTLTNPLGSFGYFYVNQTGRMDHVTYPNGQRTNYSYYGNGGDLRLQQIGNLSATNSQLSTFGHTCDAEGIIRTWSKQNDGGATLPSSFQYDTADQLIGASLPSLTSVKSYFYLYDLGGNRISEQIDNAVVSGSLNNHLNQISSMSATGPIHFAGNLSKAVTSVAVNGQSAVVDNSARNFSADVTLTTGTNTVSIVATDPNGNTSTKKYSYTVASGTDRSLTYDANGNLTSDGAGKTYAWDAANRVVTITQSSGVTQFAYDGAGRRTQEKLNGTLIKQWVWCGGAQPCEERDASNNVTKRFYGGLGEQIGGAAYFYTSDHLGSVREMTDGSGAIRARYDYDPYGRSTKTSGDLEADFGFTGFYRHQASGISLTLYRGYDPTLGRWLSRDPIGENGGINLYRYVANNPVNRMDPLGLASIQDRPLISPSAKFGAWLANNTLYPATQQIHQQIFFNDGKQPSNIGWDDKSGVVSESDSKKSLYNQRFPVAPHELDDETMRQAVQDIVDTGQWGPGSVGPDHNCQGFCRVVLDEYNRLTHEKQKKKCP